TELVYGIDLVQWQLRIASGESIAKLADRNPAPRGHAIEVRVCAEDAAAGFLPQTGKVAVYREPHGPGIRLDTALFMGWEVGADYDPMLAKLIVYGADRDEALARLRSALASYGILG